MFAIQDRYFTDLMLVSKTITEKKAASSFRASDTADCLVAKLSAHVARQISGEKIHIFRSIKTE
jgi:hypothetical protein